MIMGTGTKTIMGEERHTWPPYLLDALPSGPESMRFGASCAGLLAAIGMGPVTTTVGADRVEVHNTKTGRRWQRRPSGRWFEVDRPTTPLVLRVATLIKAAADPASRIDAAAVAAELRNSVTPWLELLKQARIASQTELGLRGTAGRVVADRVEQVMRASELRPHRLALVVDDPLALAASFDVDADLGADSRVRLVQRWAAGWIRVVGPGRWTLEWFERRNAGALTMLVAATQDRRPGQRFLIEPTTMGAQVERAAA